MDASLTASRAHVRNPAEAGRMGQSTQPLTKLADIGAIAPLKETPLAFAYIRPKGEGFSYQMRW